MKGAEERGGAGDLVLIAVRVKPRDVLIKRPSFGMSQCCVALHPAMRIVWERTGLVFSLQCHLPFRGKLLYFVDFRETGSVFLLLLSCSRPRRLLD